MTGRDSRISGSEFLIRCPGCGKGYRVHPEKLPQGTDSFNCRSCGSLVPISLSPSARTGQAEAEGIVVAVNEPELAQLVLRVLARNGLHGQIAHSGNDALDLAKNAGTALVLVSVILPDMMGYELIDRLKTETGQRVPAILLSSIHHAMRYKRAPTSLYGADDHVERHHLPDMLVPKIKRLLEGGKEEGPLSAGPVMASPPTDQDIQDQRELVILEKRQEEQVLEPQEREIRRMCRVIAADIVLYNEDVIRAAPPESVIESLSKDLQEGENLLKTRFPSFEGRSSALLREEMGRVLASRGVGQSRGSGHGS